MCIKLKREGRSATDFTKLYEMVRVASLFSLTKNAWPGREGGLKISRVQPNTAPGEPN